MNIHSATKKACILGFLLFLSINIYAGEINIYWEWSPSQEGISFFRYQKDGEIEKQWQVVDATITSYTSEDIDESKKHVLYIQQSFDGIKWGPSSSIVYNPETYKNAESEDKIIPTQDTNWDAEAIPSSTQKTAVANTTDTEANNPIQIKASPPITTAKDSSPTTPFIGPRFGLECSFGVGNLLALDETNAYADLPGVMFPAISLDLLLDNLVSYNKTLALGLITGLSFEIYAPQTFSVQFLDIHALVTLKYTINPRLSIRGGLGVMALSPYADLSQNSVSLFNSSNINIFYGITSKVTLQYAMNDSLHVGLYVDGRILFSDAFVPYELSGLLGLALGYRF